MKSSLGDQVQPGQHGETPFKIKQVNCHTFCCYSLEGTEGFLKGPLSGETASDSVDGDYDSVILDPERFEPRLDEEDTYVVTDLEYCSWGMEPVCTHTLYRTTVISDVV